MSSKDKAAFDIQPDTDMTGFGMRKVLNWRQVVQRGDKWAIVTYQFEANKFPCHACRTSDFTWLSPQRTGIYKVCLGCQTTTGPVSLEEGLILSDNPATPEKAYDVYVTHGVHRLKGMVPKLLVDQVQRRRSRVGTKARKKGVETF